MTSTVEDIERYITEYCAELFRNCLFFFSAEFQSIILTTIHYAIFIIGIYYFYFVAKPKSTYKKVFFAFCLAAYISFMLFDKCLCSVVEHCLHNEYNLIQLTINGNFGEGDAGKLVSKSNLLLIALFIGLSLAYDYRIIKTR